MRALALTLALAVPFPRASVAREFEAAPWREWLKSRASESILLALAKVSEYKPDPQETEQLLEGELTVKLSKTHRFREFDEEVVFNSVSLEPFLEHEESRTHRNGRLMVQIDSLIENRHDDELLIVWIGEGHLAQYFAKRLSQPGIYYALNGITAKSKLVADRNEEILSAVLRRKPSYDLEIVRDPVRLGLSQKCGIYAEILDLARASQEFEVPYAENSELWEAKDEVAPRVILLGDLHNVMSSGTIESLPRGMAVLASGVRRVKIALEGLPRREVGIGEFFERYSYTAESLADELGLKKLRRMRRRSRFEDPAEALYRRLSSTVLHRNGTYHALIMRILGWRWAGLEVQLVGLEE